MSNITIGMYYMSSSVLATSLWDNAHNTDHSHDNVQKQYMSLCASHLPPCTAYLVCKPVLD